MNIAPELIVWALGALGLMLSFNVHLLIRIYGKISTICTDHEVDSVKVQSDLQSLHRDQRRTDEEIQQLRRFRGSNQPKGITP